MVDEASPPAPEPASAALRDQAMALRKQGWNHAAIAEACGVSTKTVRTVLAEVLKELRQTKESSRDRLDIEVARLDALLTAVFPAAEGGDTRAVDSALKIMERRARLLGIEPAMMPGKGAARTDNRVGKKEQQQLAAESITGKFAPPPAPKLVINNE